MTPHSCFDRAIESLADLVRINSVNPTLVPGGAGEAQIARFLHSLLRQAGIEAHLQLVSQNRFNIVARLKGGGPGPRILLNGHLDTVSVEGMKSPFESIQREGKLYGRGSQDMKGGLAAAVMALLVLAQNRQAISGELVVAAVVDEEDQSLVTENFLTEWPHDQPFQFALVLEPTDLKVCTAHKGFVWLEVGTQGIAAHGSRPKEGLDAIRAMGAVLQELEGLDQHLQSHPSHPLLGSGSLHASMIHGGREWSSYPERCLLSYERRTVPGESLRTVETELEEMLSILRERDPLFRAQWRRVCARAPFEIESTHPGVSRFFEVAHCLLPDLIDWGAVSFWTDAALLAAAGIPTVVFGPRGAGLHSLEEYVIVSDVIGCAEIICEFMKSIDQPS